jgi:hypothetical protein
MRSYRRKPMRLLDANLRAVLRTRQGTFCTCLSWQVHGILNPSALIPRRQVEVGACVLPNRLTGSRAW